MEYYTLSREQIRAIAARAAELAIEQALGGNVPTLQQPTSRMMDAGQDVENVPDYRELTPFERNILSALFKK